MTLPKPNLNEITHILFPEKVKLAEKGKCVFCEKKVKEEDFRDELSKKEYGISGICFFCQKEIFK